MKSRTVVAFLYAHLDMLLILGGIFRYFVFVCQFLFALFVALSKTYLFGYISTGECNTIVSCIGTYSSIALTSRFMF